LIPHRSVVRIEQKRIETQVILSGEEMEEDQQLFIETVVNDHTQSLLTYDNQQLHTSHHPGTKEKENMGDKLGDHRRRSNYHHHRTHSANIPYSTSLGKATISNLETVVTKASMIGP